MTTTINALDKYFGSKAEQLQKRNDLKKEIIYMMRAQNSKNIMISSHNTYLAITIDGKVTHVVDQNEESNLKHITTLSKYLDVPQYEPKTAKAWLAENTKFNNEYLSEEELKAYGKKLLSSRELRSLVIKAKQSALDGVNNILEAYRKVKAV